MNPDRKVTDLSDIDVEQIVDLVRRADRKGAIDLVRGALAVARSAGVIAGATEAFNRADKVLAEHHIQERGSDG
jgi:hypothetical protein